VSSRRVTIRVPARLHRELVQAARADDISLSQFVNTEMARVLGRREGRELDAATVRSTEGDFATLWRSLAE
jgi:post-segregation antitoxin (ccd killing protein)